MTTTTYRPGYASRLERGGTASVPALIGQNPDERGNHTVIYLDTAQETTKHSDYVSTWEEVASIRANRPDTPAEHLARVLARPTKVAVLIENTYADGHTSKRVVEVTAPDAPGDVDEWWQDTVEPETGDGHGAEHPRLGFYYEATVLYAPAPYAHLVGARQDWDG